MKAAIEGSPAFSHIHLDLDPGESVIAESDAMATMDAELDLSARFNGGLFRGLGRKIFGGESLFVSEFTNDTDKTRRVTLAQRTPGEIRQIDLDGGLVCLQPGAYIASTPGLTLGTRWAGLASWIGREGLFRLEVSGTGTLWYGAYGALLERPVDGKCIVDTSHLVAYEPQLRLKVQLAGGIFSSFFGREGLVTRVEGRGRIVVQTRSLSGLAGWIRPRLFR